MLKAKKEQKQQQQQQQQQEQNLYHDLIILMICYIKLKHLDVCQYGGVQEEDIWCLLFSFLKLTTYYIKILQVPITLDILKF